ncbi:MAG TPA: OmpA family protein [Caulobacteraceae bacterium]|jgi:outer membrane protein OmpA-like peptidoglycan-associated protein
MKTLVCATAMLALTAFGTAAQSTSSQASQAGADYSADDVVKSFSQKPAPVARDACNPDADGVCQPSKDSRGFSLEDAGPAPPVGARAAAPARAETAAVSTRRHLRRAPRRTLAAAPAARRDLLITFKVGSSELTERSKANANVFVSAMKRPELADAVFEIGGHTDASGSPDRNKILAEQRAEAVRRYMVDQGANPDRLKAVGYGSDQPADAKHPDAAVNRRVEARRLS